VQPEGGGGKKGPGHSESAATPAHNSKSKVTPSRTLGHKYNLNLKGLGESLSTFTARFKFFEFLKFSDSKYYSLAGYCQIT
jgi:hypothetical protein